MCVCFCHYLLLKSGTILYTNFLEEGILLFSLIAFENPSRLADVNNNIVFCRLPNFFELSE